MGNEYAQIHTHTHTHHPLAFKHYSNMTLTMKGSPNEIGIKQRIQAAHIVVDTMLNTHTHTPSV